MLHEANSFLIFSAKQIQVKEESKPASVLDMAIDDEGISDVAKDNGAIINPSKTHEMARVYTITKFIKKYLENAKLLEHIGSDVTYVLPTHTKNSMNAFELLFQALDTKMTQLQIRSYGLSATTLEEIFLKVASNIHDGDIMRQIQHEDVTDHGRYATRVRWVGNTDLQITYEGLR